MSSGVNGHVLMASVNGTFGAMACAVAVETGKRGDAGTAALIALLALLLVYAFVLQILSAARRAS